MTKIVSPQLHRQFLQDTLVVPSAVKIPAAQTTFADTADESDNDDAEVNKLIQAEVDQGIDAEKIVMGGFSQFYRYVK